MARPSMPLTQLLFSFSGRIPRSTYWLKFMLPVIVISMIAGAIDGFMSPSQDVNIGILSGIVSLLVIYPSIAVTVKRAHDRNHTGWYVLLCFVPLVNIWVAIELGFLPGTEGRNHYGADPLGADPLGAEPPRAEPQTPPRRKAA